MMLAAAILAALALTLLAAVLVRRGAIHAYAAVPLVVLPPLAGWLLLQDAAAPARSPHTFEVLGQYHRLSDTVRIAARADADFVLRAERAGDVDLTVSFDAAQARVRVDVHRAAGPVVVGRQPVNALPLERRSVITASSGASRVVTRPWFCWRCGTRFVADAAGEHRGEVRLADVPSIAVGADTVWLFRAGSRVWAAADPRAGVHVDGEAVPGSALVLPDTLRLGADGERLHVAVNAARHRLDITYTGVNVPGWLLPRTAADTLRVLVAATAREPLAGTLPVLNPGAAAPGAAAQPYGGVLELSGGAWSWTTGGRTERFLAGVPQLLPAPERTRAAGHIVRLRQHDMSADTAAWAVLTAWLAGALALALLWRHLHPHALALRLLVLGPVYALVLVRGTLAFRAWLAPPHDANSPRTFITLLLALPALAVLLHLWAEARARSAARDRLLRDAGLAAAPLLAATVAVMGMTLPEWRSDMLLALLSAIAIPAASLALLNRLLTGGPDAGPLAAVVSPAQEGYTHRHFLSALLVLGVLGFLLLVITQLLRVGTLFAVAAWAAIFAAALMVATAPRVLIRPRSPMRPVLVGVASGVAAGAAALLFGLGGTAAAAALAAGTAAGWLLTARSGFRIAPVRLRDLAGPPLLIVIAASLLAVLLPGVLGSLRVVAEYALAVAGLVVIARIFAILWFRHTQQTAQPARIRLARPTAPGPLGLGLVAVLAMIAVYLPLAAFDAGLVLLFFAATVTALFVAFYAIGARAVAVILPVAVGAVFLAGMFVRPAALEEGTGPLRTAQIRYAATYHPLELEQHLLTSGAGRPLTTVRTLQQYWGVRHFAAAGRLDGRGYFGAAYADWIVPRPVALTENVFGTFLLSEHGWYGGAAVLLCYLLVALALLYGAGRACARVQTAPRTLLLVGIAAFWLVPAYYIAAANGVLLPLTGQNMPMLGLLSSADVVLACWLAALGLCALPLEGESGVAFLRSDGWVRRLRAAILIVAVGFSVAAVTLVALLLAPVRAQVGDFALDHVAAGVESLVEQGALAAARGADGRDSIAIAPSAAAHPYLVAGGFVRSGVHRANAIARGEAVGAGCLEADALLRVRSDGSIGVPGALCALRAAAERRQDWSGSLLLAVRTPAFAIGDGRTAVVLDPLADGVAALGPCAQAGTLRARAVRLGCAGDAPVLRYGTSAPVLESVGTPGVELNGVQASAPTLIRHGDHLRVPAALDAWAQELPTGAVTWARWENAATRRLADERVTPWLAQLDTQFARGLAGPGRAALDVVLTLHPALHAALQPELARACAAVPGARRCSALIADPRTGEILALAGSAPQPHRFLPSDANLRNHPAASAIKPILAAAALHAYPQLRTLEVDHSAAEYSMVANTAVDPSMRAARLYPAARVPLRGYIGASDNLYSATLSFIATSARGADDLPALHGGVDHSQLRVNGQPLRGRPSWTASGMDLSGSPLAGALAELFDVHVHSRTTPTLDRRFWAGALAHGALPASGELQRITPEPVGLAMNEFRSARELASFSIGGDRNRWNNVALVQAISRIHSGRAVDLHVVRAIGEQPLAADPPPFRLAADARQAVLDGMNAVTQEPWGTGYALRGTFPARVAWRAKTGTLQEREWVGSVLLFAGGPAATSAPVCHAAGVITIEMAASANPDGRATAAFRDAVAPLLRQHLGWGDRGC